MGMMGIHEAYNITVRGNYATPFVKFENRKDDILNAEYFQSSGEDSPPLLGDTLGLVSAQRQGGKHSFGVIDTKPGNKKAVAGEVRRYARDSSGDIVAEFYLQEDGTVLLTNTLGAVTIFPDGSIINQNASASTVLGTDGSFTINANMIVNGTSTLNGATLINGTTTFNGTAQGSGGPAEFSGGIDNTGGDIVSDGISLETHTHGGVTSGSESTDEPE